MEPWDHAKCRGGLVIEVGGALGLMDFGTYPTGWYIEGGPASRIRPKIHPPYNPSVPPTSISTSV